MRRKGQAPKKKPGEDESSGSDEDGDVSEEEQMLLDKKKEREAQERSRGDDRWVRSYLPRRPPQPHPQPSTLRAPSPPALEIPVRRTVEM